MGEQIKSAVKEKPLKFPLSFKKTEKALYDWCMTKRNYSGYIKDLIEADMKGKGSPFVYYNPPVEESPQESTQEPQEPELDDDLINDIINGIPE